MDAQVELSRDVPAVDLWGVWDDGHRPGHVMRVDGQPMWVVCSPLVADAHRTVFGARDDAIAHLLRCWRLIRDEVLNESVVVIKVTVGSEEEARVLEWELQQGWSAGVLDPDVANLITGQPSRLVNPN